MIFSPLRRNLRIVSTSSLEHSKWINVAVYHRLMHQATTPKINLSGKGIVEENRWKTEKIRDWKTNKQKTQNIIRLCLWRAKPLQYRHFFFFCQKARSTPLARPMTGRLTGSSPFHHSVGVCFTGTEILRTDCPQYLYFLA